MGEASQHRVVAPLSGAARAHVEARRQDWDPDLARRIEPHVTVAYHDEAPNLALLRARVEAAAARVPPFPLRLGRVEAHGDQPRRGLYHSVDDPTGVWSWLREFLLAPPFVPLRVVPHVTIAEPAAPTSLRRRWDAVGGEDPDIEFRVGALHLLVDDGDRWSTAHEWPLATAAPPG